MIRSLVGNEFATSSCTGRTAEVSHGLSEGLVVGLSSFDVSLVLVSQDWADGLWNLLEDHVPNERSETESNAPGPLLESDTISVDLEDRTTQVDDGNLGDKDDDPDTDEHDISAHSLENVKFIINLSGSKHVENLEEYEHVEDHRKMSGVGDFG